RTGRGSPSARALRSAPAQNVSPAPVRMATESDGSPSKTRKAEASADAVAASTALRRSGRSMVTTRMLSCDSVRTVMAARECRPGSRTRQRPRSAEGVDELELGDAVEVPEEDPRLGADSSRQRRQVGLRVVPAGPADVQREALVDLGGEADG